MSHVLCWCSSCSQLLTSASLWHLSVRFEWSRMTNAVWHNFNDGCDTDCVDLSHSSLSLASFEGLQWSSYQAEDTVNTLPCHAWPRTDTNIIFDFPVSPDSCFFLFDRYRLLKQSKTGSQFEMTAITKDLERRAWRPPWWAPVLTNHQSCQVFMRCLTVSVPPELFRGALITSVVSFIVHFSKTQGRPNYWFNHDISNWQVLHTLLISASRINDKGRTFSLSVVSSYKRKRDYFVIIAPPLGVLWLYSQYAGLEYMS